MTPLDPLYKQKLIDQLKSNEVYQKFPYHDSVGILTIGYGRNLDHVGISKAEAEVLLENDMSIALSDCARYINCFESLDDIRKCILINMCFNMGINKLLQFKTMIGALEEKKYETAANAMIDSEWAKQVGDRAKNLSLMMIYGAWRD